MVVADYAESHAVGIKPTAEEPSAKRPAADKAIALPPQGWGVSSMNFSGFNVDESQPADIHATQLQVRLKSR